MGPRYFKCFGISLLWKSCRNTFTFAHIFIIISFFGLLCSFCNVLQSTPVYQRTPSIMDNFGKKVKVFWEFNWKWNLLCNMTSQWEFKSPEKSESVMWLPFLWLWSYSNHPLNRSCFGYPNWILAEAQKPKTFWVATFRTKCAKTFLRTSAFASNNSAKNECPCPPP